MFLCFESFSLYEVLTCNVQHKTQFNTAKPEDLKVQQFGYDVR